MERSGFKMKGYSYPGTSPMRQEVKMSVSDKQTAVDNANIHEHTNQPRLKGGNYDAVVKSVKRQNRLDASNMSRKEIQTKLKTRKKQGVNKSEKLDVGFMGRVFTSTKKLGEKLAHQQNVSDIDFQKHNKLIPSKGAPR
tara:strand:+ start:853 stop:1269 length:417 start_codon:yes stop_codon:yes gene_type:complete